MALPQLPLKAVIGFAGSVKNGFHLHPDGARRVYPLGSTVVVSPLPVRNACANEDASAQESQKLPPATFLYGHVGNVTALAVSVTGRFIASGECVSGGGADIIIWEAIENGSSYALVKRLALHTGQVVALAFSFDESRLASIGGESDRRVVMWNVVSGSALCGSPAPADGQVHVVEFLHHSNNAFLTAGELAVSTWEYDAKAKRLSFEPVVLGMLKREILSIAIDERDEFAYLGTTSADVLCVSVKSRAIKETFTLKKHISRGITTLHMVKNGLLAGGGDGSISLFSRKPDSCVLKFESCKVLNGGAVTSISVAQCPQSNTPGLDYPIDCKSDYAKRKYLHEALKSLMSGTAQIDNYRDGSETFDVYCGTKTGELHHLEYCAKHPLSKEALLLVKPFDTCLDSAHTNQITSIAFPAQNSQHFATSAGAEIRIWHADAAKELSRIVIKPSTITCLCLSYVNDGQLLLSGWDDGAIRAHNSESGELVFMASNAHDAVTAIHGTRDYATIITGGSEGNVRVWNVRNDIITLEASMKEHRSTVNAIITLRQDSVAVTASDDGSCVVWDVARRVRKVSFFGSTYFKTLRAHPEGTQIVTTGTDHKITWWDPEDASIIRVIDAPTEAELSSLDISTPDGASIAVAGLDRHLRIFDYESGELTHVGAVSHAAPITACAFAPRADVVVTAAADGAIFIWRNPRAAFAALEREKETHVRRVLTGETTGETTIDDDATIIENTTR